MYFNPKVSIIIPVFNGSNFLKEAIESSLAQTYKNIEVIIINDGSNDNGKTESIAKSFGNKIRYTYKKNGGVATALNLGIQTSQGDFISWLSHDDVYYPHKIAHQMDILKNTNKEIIPYSNYDIIDKDSKIIGTENHIHVKPENFRYHLITSSPIHGCTTLIKKEYFKKYGFFDESLKTTQDYDMWFRLSEKINFIYSADSLIQSRHHKDQGTITLNKIHIIECNNLLINFLKSIPKESITKSTMKPLALSYAEIAKNLLNRNFLEAAKFAVKCSRAEIHSTNSFNKLLSLILIHRIHLIIKYKQYKMDHL